MLTANKEGRRRAVRRPATVLLLALLFILQIGSPASAQDVSPSERVVTGVLIRQGPSADAPVIGALKPGETLKLQGMISRWNEVVLPDGREGYVSKTWTIVKQPGQASTYTVHVIDVGTGLSVFVEGPDFTLLYDGGSNDDLARGANNRVLAYLRKVRPDLQVIDHLILSHPHRDHVELLPDVIRSYQVRNVWDSGRLNEICGYHAFLAAIADQPSIAYHDALGNFGTRAVTFQSDTCYGQTLPKTLTLKEASRMDSAPIALGASAAMSILHADAAPHASPNENSVVVRLDLGQVRLLLMGDAEAGGRKDPATPPTPTSIEGLLLTCCKMDVKADVMVVGHHGSKTSSRDRFLDAVSARDFIISAGPTKYDTVVLPDAVVRDDLARRGRLWRTDQDDAACMINLAKIGPDNDGEPGGCDNVVMTVTAATYSIAYSHPAD